MGVKDTATAIYMRKNDIFADAFNYFVYNGKQVIDPDCLEELDTREIEVPYGGEDAQQPVQRTRDVIKSCVAMTDRKSAYLVLGIENQANVHYAMPVRNMVYDALHYAQQVQNAIASHKRSGDYKSASEDEYLSGFMKQDKLIPVITLVINFNTNAWDGPMSIHEMFREQDAQVLSVIPDYRINLISPAAMDEADFAKFSTSLKEVLSFIKYAGDKDKLVSLVDQDAEFQHLGRDEVNVLNTCVGANLTMNQEEEDCNVCVAMQMIRDEAREDGRTEGRTEANIENTRRLMSAMGWPVERACDTLGISGADRQAVMERI